MTEKFVRISRLAKTLGISRQAMLKQLKGKISAGDVQTRMSGKTYLIEFNTLPEEIKAKYHQAKKSVIEQAKKLVTQPKKDLDFEKELWAAADKLRGSIDPSDYKHIVLGLLFLKYISDSFDFRRRRLSEKLADKTDKKYYLASETARRKLLEEKDFYKTKGIFYIPEKSRWDYLRSKAGLANIAEFIDSAMDELEKENPEQLSGVLPKNYVRVPLEPYVLGELVNIFSRIHFDHDQEKVKDTLGRIYEYFLGQFASAEGKRGGEFFTPRPIVKLLVEILEPFENSRVLDPACGSGGMFVQSSQFLKKHHFDPAKIAIFGQESNPTTLKLCKMNLAIRGVFGKIELGNSYYDDKFPGLKADFVLANPPFNAEWDPDRLAEKDPRLAFGIPPKSSANFMWIQHFIHHLAPSGMAGFVMANGALAVGGKEGKIREKIVQANLIDVVIACPPKLFYNVSLPVSLWFAAKNKQSGRFRNRKNEILFIDARETFEPVSRKQVIFNDEQINRIAGTVRAWRGQKDAGKYEDIAGFCRSANLEEIAKNGYVLTPGRYVGIPEEIDDGIPFAKKMKDLETDLKKYFSASQELEKEILENLGKIKL